MPSNYKRLGDYIEPTGPFNEGMEVSELLGISNQKYFQKSQTNTIGIDLEKYRIVRAGEFAFNRATTRNGDKISIALRDGSDCIVSPSYRIFRSKDENVLNSEYLMMWFRRPEFDRYARFKSHGSAHEFFDLDEMYEVQLPIPHIDVQRAMVKEYNTITHRIALNEQLNQKLEETAQTLYRHWFVDFEFPYDFEKGKPSLQGQPYKSSGGEMQWCEELDKEIPRGWGGKRLVEICSKIGSGSTPRGGKDAYAANGTSLIRSLNVHDYRFSYKDLAHINDDQAKKLNGVTVNKNDLLFNITGVSVARSCIVPDEVLPARVNQHVAIIRLIPDVKATNYLQLAICDLESKRRLLGISEGASTRQAITKTDLEEFQLLLPDEKVLTQFEPIGAAFRKRSNNIVQGTEVLFELTEVLLSKMSTIETGVASGVGVG